MGLLGSAPGVQTPQNAVPLPVLVGLIAGGIFALLFVLRLAQSNDARRAFLKTLRGIYATIGQPAENEDAETLFRSEFKRYRKRCRRWYVKPQTAKETLYEEARKVNDRVGSPPTDEARAYLAQLSTDEARAYLAQLRTTMKWLDRADSTIPPATEEHLAAVELVEGQSAHEHQPLQEPNDNARSLRRLSWWVQRMIEGVVGSALTGVVAGTVTGIVASIRK